MNSIYSIENKLFLFMGVYGRITESVNQAYRPRLHQEEFHSNYTKRIWRDNIIQKIINIYNTLKLMMIYGLTRKLSFISFRSAKYQYPCLLVFNKTERGLLNPF